MPIEVVDLDRGIGFLLRLSRALLEVPAQPGLGRTRRRQLAGLSARHWTPVHLDFILPDLDAAMARLVARGATLDRPIQRREYGRMTNMADPFGNGFDLSSSPAQATTSFRVKGEAEMR
jgi:hypothetical protein